MQPKSNNPFDFSNESSPVQAQAVCLFSFYLLTTESFSLLLMSPFLFKIKCFLSVCLIAVKNVKMHNYQHGFKISFYFLKFFYSNELIMELNGLFHCYDS